MRGLRTLRARLDATGRLQVFNLTGFASTLLTGIFLARSGLPAGDISAYEMLLFLSALVTAFWVGGGQNALLGLYAKLDAPARRGLFFQTFVGFAGASALAAVVLWAAGDALIREFTPFERVDWLPELALYTVFNPVGYLIHVYYLVLKRERTMLRVGVVNFGLQFLVAVVPVYLGYGLKAVFPGLVALAVLRWMWAAQLAFRHGTVRASWRTLLPFGAFLLPLVLRDLVARAAQFTDGLLVGRLFEDEAAFAVFHYGARELPISVLVVSALVSTGLLETARDRTAGLALLRRQSAALMRWLFPVSAVLILGSPWLFRGFYGAEFVASAAVFNVYLLLVLTRIFLPQVVIISAGKRHAYWLIWFAVVEAAVNIALSIWWGRRFGMVGIAAATVVAYAVNKALMVGYCQRRLGVGVSAYLNGRVFLGYGLVVVLAFLGWWCVA